MAYVKLEIEPGLELAVEPLEGTDHSAGPEYIGTDRVVAKAGEALLRTLESARAITEKVFEELTEKLPKKPKQIEVQFGLKFSAKLDAWVVGSEGEGNFSIKMTWEQ